MANASSTQEALPVSDEAVRAKTGRVWSEWFEILDAANATAMAHKEVATYLYEQHGVPDWWCQMVTVGYERARGLRAKNQAVDGYQVSGSKTLPIPAERLFDAWADDAERARWFPDAPLKVTKATRPKSIRLKWHDGSPLDVLIYPKGADRHQLSVTHRRLADEDAMERMRAYWKERLEALAAYVAAPTGG